MRLNTLRIFNLRNLSSLEIALEPGLSAFVGPNGAGKTTILEAAYLLSHAQTFRPGAVETLIRSGESRLTVQGVVQKRSGTVSLGLARELGIWSARVSGNPVSALADLLRELAVVCVEPGSHALVSGGSLLRRRFLDWGVFHVEPAHFASTRQFQRVLRQRNALLKSRSGLEQLDTWDAALARAAAPLVLAREQYFRRYSRNLGDLLSMFLPELGAANAAIHHGWPQDRDLREVLLENRSRDLARGHTSRGPHRADWTIRFENAPAREYLSRGQEKLCAVACVLAQAHLFQEQCGEWPVVILDDLASELDDPHQKIVLDMLRDAAAQVLITGTFLPTSLRSANPRVFHVEHGALR